MEGDRGADSRSQPRAVFAAVEEGAEAGAEEGSPEEDSLLVLYKQSGGNWAEVAEHIPGRTAKQCRERWCNHINPDIRKGDWSVVEDNIIVSLQKQWGNRWSAIAEVALRGTGDVAIAGSLGEFGEDSVEDAVSEGNSQCSG